jgi:hypothetical protein
LGLTDVNQTSKILKEMSLDVLNDIQNLPQKVTDPHWLRELDKKEEEGP